jgi:hypothetical protein
VGHLQQSLTADIQAPPSSPQPCPSVGHNMSAASMASGRVDTVIPKEEDSTRRSRSGVVITRLPGASPIRGGATPDTCGPAQPAPQRLLVSPMGSADAFMKLASPCTILSLRAVTASFVLQ